MYEYDFECLVYIMNVSENMNVSVGPTKIVNMKVNEYVRVCL